MIFEIKHFLDDDNRHMGAKGIDLGCRLNRHMGAKGLNAMVDMFIEMAVFD